MDINLNFWASVAIISVAFTIPWIICALKGTPLMRFHYQ